MSSRIFRTQRPLATASPRSAPAPPSRPFASPSITPIGVGDRPLPSLFTPPWLQYHHHRRIHTTAAVVPPRPRDSTSCHPTPPRHSPSHYLLLHRHQQHHARMSTSATAKVEEAKGLAAKRAVAEHFDPSFKFVGIGSGTTILYVINEIKRVLGDSAKDSLFVPTGYQSRAAIVDAGLTPIAFDTLPDDIVLDVAFDGADEVDDELNCIKGGGACLFQEKLVAERAKKFVCVADYRKLQPRLLTNWPTIPIEVAPIATQAVLYGLSVLGSTNPKVRSGVLAKAGPLKTDQDFFIIDAPFPQPLLTSADVAAGKGKGDGSDGTWEVTTLSAAIKRITGVLEVGLFCGIDGVTAFSAEAGSKKGTAPGGQKPVAVYFGMQDGSVEVRNRVTS